MKHGKQITHNCSTVSAWCSDDSFFFFPLYYHLEVIHVASYQYTATNCIMISKDSSSPPTCFLHTKTTTSSMSFVGSIPEFSRKCLKRTLDRERLLIRHCVQVVTASVHGSIAVRRVKLF